jgi:hypothetical protein
LSEREAADEWAKIVGVNIFILDRRPAKLAVAGVEHEVGSLRGFWKITELDEERAGDLSAWEAAVSAMPSPKAALIADVVEMPLASKTGIEVSAHLVIGWDEGRTSVTDMGWDYLPVLGYAVRDPASGIFALHERRDGALHRLDHDRAVELGLIGPDGQLLRRGQPVITGCENVRAFLDKYADADCTLSTGNNETLMTAIEGGELPSAEWFVGKTPMQIKNYPSKRRSGSASPEPHP